MKATVALLVLLGAVAAAAAYSEREYQAVFTAWMAKNRKTYGYDEFVARYAIFKQNMDMVKAHNQLGGSYRMALNSLADLSAPEFAKYYLGARYSAAKFDSSKVDLRVGNVSAPASYDWRQEGAVTGVKNQGQCGSCWSFSTTGSVEGCHKLAGKTLVGLSEQNLVDCSTSYGNEGCNGGLMTQAFQYIISNGGIDTEASYPYTAADGTCQYSPANSGATLKSYVNVAQGSETDLLTKGALGPVSVAIDASHSSFQFYSSGVYYEPDCSSTQLDHGVLMVGWGTDTSSNSAYWIVKNSWGTDWGMSGYIWMARNQNNNCGIATMASLPTGC